MRCSARPARYPAKRSGCRRYPMNRRTMRPAPRPVAVTARPASRPHRRAAMHAWYPRHDARSARIEQALCEPEQDAAIPRACRADKRGASGSVHRTVARRRVVGFDADVRAVRHQPPGVGAIGAPSARRESSARHGNAVRGAALQAPPYIMSANRLRESSPCAAGCPREPSYTSGSGGPSANTDALRRSWNRHYRRSVGSLVVHFATSAWRAATGSSK